MFRRNKVEAIQLQPPAVLQLRKALGYVGWLGTGDIGYDDRFRRPFRADFRLPVFHHLEDRATTEMRNEIVARAHQLKHPAATFEIALEPSQDYVGLWQLHLVCEGKHAAHFQTVFDVAYAAGQIVGAPVVALAQQAPEPVLVNA